jgi:hypothetical protein
MTDTLPIVFARGQNESIDPRLAPTDVHAVAQNVRWRKDGRPAKRYGISQVSATGLDSGGTLYASQYVNSIDSWSESPLLVIGSGVRQLIGSSWTDAVNAKAAEVSHWAPGRRDPIVRSDATTLENASVGYANGYLLYAWDDGSSIFTQVRQSTSGAIVLNRSFGFGSGNYVRCVGIGTLIYVLTRNGTQLQISVFDTSTLTFTIAAAFVTLNAAADFFDASVRGSDWLLVYQSGASTLTANLYTAANPPVISQTQSITMSAAQVAKMAIAGTSTSSVFVAFVEATSGKVRFSAFNNALTSLTSGPNTLETDANNVDQPGIAIDGDAAATIVWGGYVAATQSSYLRNSAVTAAGSGAAGLTHFGVRPASKPFYGPAQSTLGSLDGIYIWTHTHNSDATNAGSRWDDQRTLYLMRLFFPPFSLVSALARQMHTPNLVASTGSYTSHLAEAVNTGSGYVSALMNTIRFGNAAAENYGVESISFHSIRESQRYAARDTALAGRALQIAGGALYEFNGASEETGFSSAPVIQSITGSGGGGLTGASNYLYVAVFEWLDASGRRHRSIPSDPFLFASGANSTATLAIKPLISTSRSGAPSLHVYRTLAGGASYHRVTPNVGAPGASPSTATVAYVDLMADTTAAANEFLYTDGGVVANALPPPCTFMTVCGGRIWLGGQLDRNVITASKILVDGEPTQFSDEAEFSVFLPEGCTGLASIDGTVVAFAREAIYLISGDGPNDEGVGSFSPPQKLPSDVGCIDWRSVVSTSQGIFFQSKHGIYLLPRGFNTPVFVGFEVVDTMAIFPICMSATLVSVPASSGKLGEVTVRFVMGNAENSPFAVCLVYDLRARGWSVDISPNNSPQLGPGGTWSDTFVQTKSISGHFDSIWQESNSTFDDGGSFITTELGTGDIRPFGVAGYGGFERVVVLGEFRGAAFVNVNVSVDAATPDFFSFDVSAADPGVGDGSVYLDVTPRVRMGSAIRVTVSDTSGTASEGFIAQALFIEHETIGKTKRLAAARRR